MLWLERLEVSGFKSFSDKSTIEFPRGITAVVGPNGCGKSNIADAISWVLGEQSARALRGQKMEDVIFAGTQGRGPGGLAEVSLHMAAKNGTLPDGRARVTLTRRLFRSGNSEYLIDGKKSRLADVRALLDQVRAGVRSYAIIDQGSVASFVLSKPKDRRVFIEEAAGIAGYKTRRRMAELKLEATRANLLRIDDIVGEVARQQRSLKRQASLARRARRLEERLRALKTVWYRRRDALLAAEAADSSELCAVASREADHLDRERRRLATALADARRRLEHAHSDREQAVAASHSARIEEEQLDREIDAALTRAASLEEEAGRREGESDRLVEERVQRAEEIARLEEEIRSLAGELAGLSERSAAARQVVEREKAELERRRQVAATHEQALYDRVHRKAELSARASAAQAAERRDERRAEEARQAGERLGEALATEKKALAEVQRRQAEAETTVSRLELELERARDAEDDCWTALEQARADETDLVRQLGARSGEKEALDSLEVRLAGAEAAREILEHSREGKLRARQVVAELLSVEKDVEQAAERFLGDLLPAVVVDSAEDVQKGARLGVGGRVRFLPLDDAATGEAGRGELPAELAAHPGVRGRLSEHLRPTGEMGRAIHSRLHDAVLVDSLALAFELHRRFPGFDFLTPEGHAVHAGGVVTVESDQVEGAEGLLGRTRRREELAALLERLDRQRAAAAEAVERARQAHRDAQLVRRRVEEELAGARRAQASASFEAGQHKRSIERLEHEAEVARAALATALEGLERARREAAEAATEQQRLEAEIAAERERLEGIRGALREQEEVLRRAEAEASARLSDERALRERHGAQQQGIERLQRELQALEQRREEGRRVQSQALERAAELREQAAERGERLEAARSRREQLEQEVEAWSGRLNALAAEVDALDARHGKVIEEFEQARSRREAAALAVEKARLEVQHERESCREDLGCEPTELPAEPPEGIEGEILDNDGLLLEELRDVKLKRERLGMVNLLAEQEFEELSARFEELSSQREDLERSVDELSSSIRKMDRESRERFLEAFEAIRKHFRAQFTILFRGGRADLLLEDDSEVLESGIEIMCQPPGKKLQSVSLLSGGEKALAATAMLFAIFRYQPPPFCLLDEIDAPLDDTNVHRFTEAVREFASSTQIILITHNKRSMETADVLYGVTMPEPGISSLVSMALD